MNMHVHVYVLNYLLFYYNYIIRIMINNSLLPHLPLHVHVTTSPTTDETFPAAVLHVKGERCTMTLGLCHGDLYSVAVKFATIPHHLGFI